MCPSYLIGLDIGTSGAKAVVIDKNGRLMARAGQEYPIQMPFPGWAEQNPEDWAAAALSCIRSAVREAGIGPHEAAAIGLAGQMHSLVCLDARGEPLRPAILWADQRSGGQVKRLTEQIGINNLAEWTGNPLASGFMLASWVWLLENEPSSAASTRWLMLPKDYVRYVLTGAIGTEPGDASSTLLFDPHTLSWSKPILELAGLDEGRLPPVFPSSSVAGGLRPEAAEACGLTAGTPVIFGSSDVSLQALAQGVVEPGIVSCTIGTGGQLFAPVNAPRHDPLLRLHLFCHAVPSTWHHEAAILSAGLALRWLRDQIWPGSDFAGLADGAAEVESGLDGLFFLPFLVGERTPYMDTNLRAAFIGLGLRHRNAHLVRAVMEGVVFELRQGLDLLLSLGTQAEFLLATGGAVRHPLWLQLQADIFNRPIHVSKVDEATARGAAVLAGIGAGLYQDAQDAIRQTSQLPAASVMPNPERAGRYEAAYRTYRQWAGDVVDRYRSGW